MAVKIIIGKNFGDEGKGLAADFFAMRAAEIGHSAICVRHNGGAQAGHTVDRPDRRFVFSQLSSASFRGACTYWADSFMPDLYKLGEEVSGFRGINCDIPALYGSERCRCTYIGDVLINMLLETSRGDRRHGSCGMGINEAAVRSETFPLYLGDVIGIGAEALYRRLSEIHREYLPLRLAELGIEIDACGEYGEMLKSSNVLLNASEEMCRNAEYVQLKPQSCITGFDDIIFEGAQGLMLDELNLEYAPNLTTSRTGLYEPVRILRGLGNGLISQAEAVYVTRSYVTRHGAGKLPYEGLLDPQAHGITDRTNLPNEWQGSLRFAPHGGISEFTENILRDVQETEYQGEVSLFVTHLNESGGDLLTNTGTVGVREYLSGSSLKSASVYCSGTPFAEDVFLLK